jgi:fatty-acyl-CoA synthase
VSTDTVPRTTVFEPDWAGRTAIIIEPSGDSITFGELEARSNRAAQFFRSAGLATGRTVAIAMENRIDLLVLAFGAQRAGLYYVVVNTHLTPAEAGYIIADSGAALVVSSAQCRSAVGEPAVPAYSVDPIDDPLWRALDLADYPAEPIADQAEGDFLLYSSGTTGRPKGIERALGGGAFGTYPDIPGKWLAGLLGFGVGDVYLCPAPLYHAAPLGWSMGALRHGGTVVVMEHFDAAAALELIERHRVTHSQWVPTMFVRMLKLDAAVRDRHDLRSHRVAVHAAAPCPVAVKHAMIDWWGPILFEFYSATEGVGATSIFSADWLTKPGSVGKPIMGTPHILDDDHQPLGPGEVGTVWFSGGSPFTYHGNPEKTAQAYDDAGRSTVGDMGWLDEDGYLFLADRRTNLIISGGVNIYPREIEDALILHPDVDDVAVVGAPDEEMGQRVVAHVAPRPGASPSAESLTEFARKTLAGFKIPRDYRFVDTLPRTPTGKLRKHLLV